jgi:hypothetical protein
MGCKLMHKAPKSECEYDVGKKKHIYEKNTFPFLFTLKLAKHGQSKGVTLRKSTESAMWAGSPPHRNGHERHPRYVVLYDFSFGEGGGGGMGPGKAEETKILCFFSTLLQL